MTNVEQPLGQPVQVVRESAGEEFAFMADPLHLLSPEERTALNDDLADLARLRREVEADGATLRLA